MNRDDIIRMAREAGLVNWEATAYANELERFAALVAFAERESLRESFRVVTAAETSAAILHEREACAKVCEEYETNNDIAETWLNIVSEVIRARAQA